MMREQKEIKAVTVPLVSDYLNLKRICLIPKYFSV